MPRAWKAWLVLSALSILTLFLGHHWGDRQGLLWSVVLALGLNAFFYFYSDFFLRPLFRGRMIEGRDPWHLNEILHKLCLRARVPQPGLCVLPQLSPQAFALEKSWGRARIYLTEGLLRRLEEKEIEAILAFELALIKRHDTFSMAVASAFIASLFTLTRSLDWIFQWLVGSKGKSQSRYFFTSLFSPLAGLLVRLTLHPKDFYAADSLAATWLEDPKPLASALWKLQSLRQTQPWKAPVSTSHLFVVNPLTHRGWTRYLHVQPSVETRIKRLIGHYPL